jgi:hypothetical protein
MFVNPMGTKPLGYTGDVELSQNQDLSLDRAISDLVQKPGVDKAGQDVNWWRDLAASAGGSFGLPETGEEIGEGLKGAVRYLPDDLYIILGVEGGGPGNVKKMPVLNLMEFEGAIIAGRDEEGWYLGTLYGSGFGLNPGGRHNASGMELTEHFLWSSSSGTRPDRTLTVFDAAVAGWGGGGWRDTEGPVGFYGYRDLGQRWILELFGGIGVGWSRIIEDQPAPITPVGKNAK